MGGHTSAEEGRDRGTVKKGGNKEKMKTECFKGVCGPERTHGLRAHCPPGGNEIDKNAEIFPESGVVDETVAPYVKKKSAFIAVILSFLVPGLGQISYVQIRGGVLFIIISIILLLSILTLILSYIVWPLFW